jgi:hypothetical protein
MKADEKYCVTHGGLQANCGWGGGYYVYSLLFCNPFSLVCFFSHDPKKQTKEDVLRVL